MPKKGGKCLVGIDIGVPHTEGTRLGDEMSRGLTAGSGNDGAGDADRRIEGEDPNEERRL